MGGRKGHSLKDIIENPKRIISLKKQLIRGIENNEPLEIVGASAGILAKSEKNLDALAYGYLFVDSLKKDYDRLREENIKERKVNISKKWALFRKRNKKSFDPATNRNVVDPIARILGRKK